MDLEHLDIDRKLDDYITYHMSPKRRNSNRIGRALVKEITVAAQTPVLLAQHIKSLAWLLGYEEHETEYGKILRRMNSPIKDQVSHPSICSDTFRQKIVPLIEPKFIIPFASLPALAPLLLRLKAQSDKIAYARQGVEAAFDTLQRSSMLRYTQERFDYTVNRILSG